MQFGKMLKSYRISRGMRNRTKFAREVGVSTETMRLLEGGKSLPRVDTLRSMLQLLQLEKWEHTKLTMCWFDERMRTVASELPSSLRRTFITRFCQEFDGHLIAALGEELPVGRLDDLIMSLTVSASAVLADLLGLSDPDDTEVDDE